MLSNVLRGVAVACVLAAALPAVASAQTTSLVEKASGRPAISSSVERTGLEPAKGNDGSATTRWGSRYADGQWWQVDLGAVRAVSEVRVNWEAAYASRYRIQTSVDGSSWSTAAEPTATSGGSRVTTFAQRNARYVRLTGITRGTPYGISFWEFQVYGPADATSPPTPTPAPSSGVFVSTTGNDATGTGAADRPYRTVGKAVSVASPGATVYVRGGTYGPTTIAKSGTSTAPITVKPYPGEKVYVNGATGTKSRTQSAVNISGSYVRFEGFDVRNADGRGITAYDVVGAVLKGNTVHDTWAHPIMVGGDTITVEGNEVYNGILSNANGRRLDGAFWPAGISTWSRMSGARSSNIVFKGNTVRDTWGEGIGPYNASNVTIADNVVHDTYSVNIYLTEVRGALVERNYVYSTNAAFNRNGRPADGIFIANEGSGTGGSPSAPFSNDMLIRNNIVARAGYGIWFWYDSSRTTNNSYANVRILNNVIKDTAAANVRFMDVPSSQTQPTGNVLRNNVLYGNVQIDDAGGWARSNNWAVPTQGDPKLVSPVAGGAKEGFRVQTGSPLLHAGLASAEVPTDMWGAARSTGPTIGVHEG